MKSDESPAVTSVQNLENGASSEKKLNSLSDHQQLKYPNLLLYRQHTVQSVHDQTVSFVQYSAVGSSDWIN